MRMFNLKAGEKKECSCCKNFVALSFDGKEVIASMPLSAQRVALLQAMLEAGETREEIRVTL